MPDSRNPILPTAPADAIEKLGAIARELTGVQLTDKHRAMIQSRLQKRLIDLNLGSIDDYLAYFQANRATEAPKLVSLLTTHHTYFFREFTHFEYILQTALPALLPELLARPDRKLRVWSAACSRGQEAYSLAMMLDAHLRRLDPSLKYEIIGTDVDPESVSIATNAVYLHEELKEVPLALLGNHWSRGTGDIDRYVKAKPSLTSHCQFKTANLLELAPESSALEGKHDLIFCRNVFIYFNPEQVRQISAALLSRLHPQGYLFVGISESLSQLRLPVQSLGPSVYQHRQTAKSPAPRASAAKTVATVGSPPATEAAKAPSRPVRVLCVDDSPVILSLLQRILTREQGFEVVGTAANGGEARDRVSALKPDVLTLDIHMPEMTGVEYLAKHFGPGHPPVVMVTSVSREDSGLAGQALALGAADYVEKPALNNLVERGDELRTKLRCAVMAGAVPNGAQRLGLDRAFQSKRAITHPNQKLRVIALAASQRKKLRTLIGEMTGPQPPTFLLIDGSTAALPQLESLLASETGKQVRFSDRVPERVEAGEFWLLDLGSHAHEIATTWAKRRQTSLLVLGELSRPSATALTQFAGTQIVLEDLGQGRGIERLMSVASDVVLPSSFAYLSCEYLSESLGAVPSPKKGAA